MIPIYHDPHFTFRFAEDRIIPRIHLEGIEAGRRVSVFKVDSGTGARLGVLATTTVGEGGWVELAVPIIVKAGEAFIAVPESGRLKHSAGIMLLYGIGMIGVLAIVGYLSGLIVGGGNQFILAVCGGVLGGCVVLLGYGPVALFIRPLGALSKWFHGKKHVDIIERTKPKGKDNENACRGTFDDC